MARMLLSALVWATLSAPPAAFAAAGGGGETGDLIKQLINFALLLGVLFYFGRKPISAFFQERREAIMTQLSQASDLHTEAEENYARWQRKLNELESEIAGIRSTAQERAEREANQIVADAQATAERIQRDATATIDQELRRAQSQLRAETAELAIELAAGILRDDVTDHDRTRLLDEFIDRIDGGAGATNGSPS